MTRCCKTTPLRSGLPWGLRLWRPCTRFVRDESTGTLDETGQRCTRGRLWADSRLKIDTRTTKTRFQQSLITVISSQTSFEVLPRGTQRHFYTIPSSKLSNKFSTIGCDCWIQPNGGMSGLEERREGVRLLRIRDLTWRDLCVSPIQWTASRATQETS